MSDSEDAFDDDVMLCNLETAMTSLVPRLVRLLSKMLALMLAPTLTPTLCLLTLLKRLMLPLMPLMPVGQRRRCGRSPWDASWSKKTVWSVAVGVACPTKTTRLVYACGSRA
jgi:hypothetical protein